MKHCVGEGRARHSDAKDVQRRVALSGQHCSGVSPSGAVVGVTTGKAHKQQFLAPLQFWGD